MITTQINQFHQRIEIAFWALLIPIMKETLRLRIAVPQMPPRIGVLRTILFAVQTLILALSGLVLGLTLGYTYQLAW